VGVVEVCRETLILQEEDILQACIDALIFGSPYLKYICAT